MSIFPTHNDQKKRLLALLDDSAGWGVAIYMEPLGDVSILVPIVPKLVGYEIVSATSDDPPLYDIWRKGKRGGVSFIHQGWTKAQVTTWLARNTPDEDTLHEHVGEWTEKVLIRYGHRKLR